MVVGSKSIIWRFCQGPDMSTDDLTSSLQIDVMHYFPFIESFLT